VFESVFFKVSETPTPLYKLCDGIDLKTSWNDYTRPEQEQLMIVYEFLNDLTERNLIVISLSDDPSESGLQFMRISLKEFDHHKDQILTIVSATAYHCAQRRWGRMNQHVSSP